MNNGFDNNENLNPEIQPTEEPKVEEVPEVEEAPEADEVSEVEEAPVKPKKKKKIWIPIVIIVAVVALLVVGGIIIYNTFFKTEPFRGDLFNENLLCVKKDGKWGYVNKNGKYVIKAKYDFAENFDESGLALVGKYDEEEGRNLCGYINKKGETVVKMKYYSTSGFYDCGLAAVMNEDGEWGVINKKGEEIIKPKYEDVEIYDDGVIVLTNSKGKSYIADKDGEAISDKYDSVVWYEEAKVAAVMDDDEVGIINAKGKEILELTDDYDGLGYFNKDGVGFYVEDSKIGIITKKGKEITDAEYDFMPCYNVDSYYGGFFNENNLAIFMDEDDEWGVINSKGKIVVKAGEYAEIYHMNDGYFIAYDEDEETGYVLDEKGKEVFSFEEDDGWLDGDFFMSGLALVEDEEGNYGYVNKKGDLVIDCDYFDAYDFSLGGIARVIEEEGDEFSFIDKKGKSVGKSYTYATDFYDDGYAIVVEADGGEINYSVINEKGRKVCSIECDDIMLPYGRTILGSSISYVLDSEDFDAKEFLINYYEENYDEDEFDFGYDYIEEYVQNMLKYMDEESIRNMIVSLIRGNSSYPYGY